MKLIQSNTLIVKKRNRNKTRLRTLSKLFTIIIITTTIIILHTHTHVYLHNYLMVACERHRIVIFFVSLFLFPGLVLEQSVLPFILFTIVFPICISKSLTKRSVCNAVCTHLSISLSLFVNPHHEQYYTKCVWLYH